MGSSQSLIQFITELKNKRIDTALRRNDIGFLFGITFIDHKSKCVFNGRDLDKQLSASGIQQYFSTKVDTPQIKAIHSPTTVKPLDKGQLNSTTSTSSPSLKIHFEIVKKRNKTPDEMIRQFDLLKQLLQIEKSFNISAFGFTRKKKKKKNSGL